MEREVQQNTASCQCPLRWPERDLVVAPPEEIVLWNKKKLTSSKTHWVTEKQGEERQSREHFEVGADFLLLGFHSDCLCCHFVILNADKLLLC